MFKFLLIGCGRSGTTLLTSLLDYHSQIEMGFEKFANECLRGKDISETDQSMYFDRTSMFLKLCEEEAAGSVKPIWGNKILTEHIAGLNKHNLFNLPPLPILETFFDETLNALKIVYILRDGRSCIASKLKRRSPPLVQAVRAWKFSVKVYQALQGREDTTFVRYENLVQSPETILQEICQFLDVEYEPSMLGGTNNQKMTKDYRANNIDATKARVAEVSNKCFELIKDDLVATGYL